MNIEDILETLLIAASFWAGGKVSEKCSKGRDEMLARETELMMQKAAFEAELKIKQLEYEIELLKRSPT